MLSIVFVFDNDKSPNMIMADVLDPSCLNSIHQRDVLEIQSTSTSKLVEPETITLHETVHELLV